MTVRRPLMDDFDVTRAPARSTLRLNVHVHGCCSRLDIAAVRVAAGVEVVEDGAVGLRLRLLFVERFLQVVAAVEVLRFALHLALETAPRAKRDDADDDSNDRSTNANHFFTSYVYTPRPVFFPSHPASTCC